MHVIQFHSIKCYVMIIFAVITICFGVQMKKSKSPKYTVWVVVGYIVYHMVIEIILKAIDLYSDRPKPTGRYALVL